MKSSRNQTFDTIKGIACIAIVFMHCEFPGTFGSIVQCLTRWSVPFFFAVSGFYCWNATARDCLQKAKRIFRITAAAAAFYIFFTLIQSLLIGATIQSYFDQAFTIKGFLAWIVFNSPMLSNGHLWFLYALIYVYVFYAGVVHFRLMEKAYVLIPILFATHFLLAYGGYMLGMDIANGFFRNFLFEGIPAFLLGMYVRQWADHATDADMRKKSRIAGAAALVALLLSWPERLLVGRDFPMHILSVVALVPMLVYAAADCAPRCMRALSPLGKKYSTMIYIVHPAVMMTVDFWMGKTTLAGNLIYGYARPIFVLLLSILISIFIHKCVGHAGKARRAQGNSVPL